MEYEITSETEQHAMSPCPLAYWLDGGTDLQLAADTFATPVAFYSSRGVVEHSSILYLPFRQPLRENPQHRPLIMHYRNNIHWDTIVVKPSIKIEWPPVMSRHAKVWQDLQLPMASYKTIWRYLHIKKQALKIEYHPDIL
ncbi:hypothetical protein EC973_009534 [Apophysomyces ossiformis]|uniref:Uncharacterized protein n=1 Tax=Apophysomyces ossiformis TaxID=679940 RepID=A0A8H7END7_9FUNG|nr:hypothetical protein EC973_009534 [Apophysomyces ossiformis]